MVETCFWEALLVVREALVRMPSAVQLLAGRLRESRRRLLARSRGPRPGAPSVATIYERAAAATAVPPEELVLEPGKSTTLRGELGRVLGWYNRDSGGALIGAAADLLGSTSASALGAGFAPGFYRAGDNRASRLLAVGGICEDAMAGVLAGLSTFGRHLGVGSSYAAFLAPLGHIAARLHAIGMQARQAATGEPCSPLLLVCAHAGLKTGEDGPTHADPQALQVLCESFPRGTLLTLTPFEPSEIWPLMAAALRRRPAVIAPFVTRPTERVPDRAALGLAPAAEAAQGVYALRRARGAGAHSAGDGVVVLQESGVAYAFVEEALPVLEAAGVDLTVYYVSSAELFDLLPEEERERIFPAADAARAMGITGFTLPTIYRWVTSAAGRAATLHPFAQGHFLGSGPARQVLEEAGLDGASQAAAVLRFLGREPAVEGAPAAVEEGAALPV
jgi:transketolase